MIPSIAADFVNAADAIAGGYFEADALGATHVLVEIGQAWLDGIDNDTDMANRLRRISDTKRCIVHDETFTTVCRGCRADEIAAKEETA